MDAKIAPQGVVIASEFTAKRAEGREELKTTAQEQDGRPIAASEAQQDRVLKLHKAGRSSRWIAEETGLSRRTVTTVIEKSDGTGRTTSKRRVRLGLEPKRNDWRQAAITNLPRRATGLRKEAKKLLKEARDGRA